MTFHQKNDTARFAVIKRIIIYSIFFFILGIAQCSFFANLSFLSTVPNLVLGALASVALIDSQKSTTVCAIASGFMIDALGGAGISLSPLVYLAIALVCSAIARKMLPSFFSWLIILLSAVLMNALYSFVYILVSFSEISIVETIKSILLPEAVCTFVLSLPIFFITLKCVDIADTKNKFKM